MMKYLLRFYCVAQSTLSLFPDVLSVFLGCSARSTMVGHTLEGKGGGSTRHLRPYIEHVCVEHMKRERPLVFETHKMHQFQPRVQSRSALTLTDSFRFVMWSYPNMLSTRIQCDICFVISKYFVNRNSIQL